MGPATTAVDSSTGRERLIIAQENNLITHDPLSNISTWLLEKLLSHHQHRSSRPYLVLPNATAVHHSSIVAGCVRGRRVSVAFVLCAADTSLEVLWPGDA